MSLRGAILSILLLFILVSGALAGAEEIVTLNFAFAESDQQVVEKSLAMDKSPSAFMDTSGDGVFDEVHFNGQIIGCEVDFDRAIGFSFEDGWKMAFYPTKLGMLPDPGTYEVLGFLHHWNESTSNFVAILVHQHENYQTSEGITVYVINRAGIRVGSLFDSFLDKAFLRYTQPYLKWIETGEDFAIGSSPLVSNYVLIGKDLGLMDSVLVLNFSLAEGAVPPGQDLKIRENQPAVVEESLRQQGQWGAFGGSGGPGSIFSSVRYGGEVVSGNILVDRARGFEYRDGRAAVFYPSDLSSLPSAPRTGVNWELLGFLHYFNEPGTINSVLAVLLGQTEGEETTSGAKVAFVDNTGMAVGVFSYQFFSRRSIATMSTYERWTETGYNWAIGRREGMNNKFNLAWDLGIVDKILVVAFRWY